jgi:hypothetical protein
MKLQFSATTASIQAASLRTRFLPFRRLHSERSTAKRPGSFSGVSGWSQAPLSRPLLQAAALHESTQDMNRARAFRTALLCDFRRTNLEQRHSGFARMLRAQLRQKRCFFERVVIALPS